MKMTMSQQTIEQGAVMTAKAAPPLAVVGANIAGWPVPDLVQWVTLAYVSCLLAHQVWKMCWGAYKFWILKKRDE